MCANAFPVSSSRLVGAVRSCSSSELVVSDVIEYWLLSSDPIESKSLSEELSELLSFKINVGVALLFH